MSMLDVKKWIENVSNWLKGGTSINTTETLIVEGNTGNNIGYRAENVDNNTYMNAGFGVGGANHGLWSSAINKWMIHNDGTYTYINGRKLDVQTNNTTGTWVPVIDGDVNHRVIPTAYNNAPTTLLQISQHDISITAAANQYTGKTGTASKSGYYPLGIIGIDMVGSGSGSTIPLKWYLYNRATGSCSIQVGVRNVTATQYSVTFRVYILWTKTS